VNRRSAPSPDHRGNPSPVDRAESSPGAGNRLSLSARADASRGCVARSSKSTRRRGTGDARFCDWCRKVELHDVRSRFCSKLCRQSAFRLRRRTGADPSPVPTARPSTTDRPLRVAFADPPYPGKAFLYDDQPTYGGEVDHVELLDRLRSEFVDGWALSTSSAALRELLPLCPPEARVCAWVKPNAPSPKTYGLHSRWEALIVVPARRLQPGMSDWLLASPARLGGETLIGRKPLAFCAFLFRALGLRPGDELVDLFPGTGIVGRAWAEASRSTWATDESGSADDGSAAGESDG
jgi:hypothetical protein